MTGDGYALVLHGDADPSKLGGTAVCGFSSTGMVGVIAASHMIRAWDLEQMGTVLDENFPAMALVQESVPKHPVRVYQGDGIGVFTSEIQFPAAYDVKFAETVLKWFVEGGFDRLIIIDGVVPNEIGQKEEGDLWGVSSHPLGRKALAGQPEDVAGEVRLLRFLREPCHACASGWSARLRLRQRLSVSCLIARYRWMSCSKMRARLRTT